MKIAIQNIINCDAVTTATVYINNSTENVTKRNFIKINEDYALGDDGCIYQIITKSDADEMQNSILIFEANDVFYNYAEDELDVEETIDFINEIESKFADIDENDFEELIGKSNYSYDSDEENASFNQFVKILMSKLEGYSYYFSNLCFFCGMTKRFNDYDTRYNPYYSETEYVPHTIYYFF